MVMKRSMFLSTHAAPFQAATLKGNLQANIAKTTGPGYAGVERALRRPTLEDARELVVAYEPHGNSYLNFPGR